MNTKEKIEMYKSFPEKRMGGAVLLFDEEKKLMVVKPTYRDHWMLPGGISEKGEAPSETAVREVKEEIGLDILIKKLVLIDYKKNLIGEDYINEFLSFIFLAEAIAEKDKERIVLPDDELSDYKFVEVREACELLIPCLGNRIKAMGDNYEDLVYMEHGERF